MTKHLLRVKTVCLLTFAVVLSYPASNNRIINGEEEYGPTPYVVSIQKDNAHICVGLIYSNRWVLTVASCVENISVNFLVVSINDYNFINSNEPYEQKVSVFKIIINEAYNATTKENNIALLELSESLALVPVSENEINGPLGPSCLRYDEYSSSFMDRGYVYGWGLTEINGPTSVKLQKAVMKMTSLSNCSAFENFSPSTMLCALGTKAQNSDMLSTPCSHDEGSPLVFLETGSSTNKAALGLFSYNDHCSSEKPSVFIRLSVYYGWLNQIAGYQPSECYYQ